MTVEIKGLIHNTRKKWGVSQDNSSELVKLTKDIKQEISSVICQKSKLKPDYFDSNEE